MSGDERRRGHRVVPVCAFIHGRTRAAGQELPLEAVVCATGRSAGDPLEKESRAIAFPGTDIFPGGAVRDALAGSN